MRSISLYGAIMIILLSMPSMSSVAQQTYLKAYTNNFFFDNESIPDLDLPSNGWWRFRDISLAMTWRQVDSSFFEIELSRFQMRENTDDDGYDLDKQVYSIRFEYGVPINIFSDWEKGDFYLGGSLRPYYARVHSQPPFSTDFPTTWRDIGTVVSVIPRFEFPFHERWFLDINIVFDVINMAHSYTKVENPLLTENQQENSGFEAEVGWLDTGIRVGFAYML